MCMNTYYIYIYIYIYRTSVTYRKWKWKQYRGCLRQPLIMLRHHCKISWAGDMKLISSNRGSLWIFFWSKFLKHETNVSCRRSKSAIFLHNINYNIYSLLRLRIGTRIIYIFIWDERNIPEVEMKWMISKCGIFDIRYELQFLAWNILNYNT